MQPDILRQSGRIFLGSRLKRLGERMQAGAARVIAEAGLPVQPTHMPLLAALEACPLTIGQLVQSVGISQPGVTRAIGQLVALDLVRSDTGTDQRRRTVSLTDAGRAVMARARLLVWPRIEGAVDTLCDGDAASLLARIAALEEALASLPLDVRAAAVTPQPLRIRDFSDGLAHHFTAIGTEWLTEMFRLEATDRQVLDDPRGTIIRGGGAILFVEAEGLGIVGTCALQRSGGDAIELTKMGVRASARGLKAGEFLLHATIARAREMGADPLYLLTNARCAAAIHLYEKAGFRHDADIMATYGARYARCDVAMRHVGAGDAG
ncbi:MAG: bifunctional helix-turn-helix transcriptional regulator/GNAT family N-acetyltransferase [Sphingomonas adhaesiva]|uniref:bifunctional helix-turn-helix transcriptional regulator/GNAT family N-acetyltransferase n=1 Tax=Sphingomonas adhaesiva TaxID=28212 RepID=UPI002FF70650